MCGWVGLAAVCARSSVMRVGSAAHGCIGRRRQPLRPLPLDGVQSGTCTCTCIPGQHLALMCHVGVHPGLPCVHHDGEGPPAALRNQAPPWHPVFLPAAHAVEETMLPCFRPRPPLHVPRAPCRRVLGERRRLGAVGPAVAAGHQRHGLPGQVGNDGTPGVGPPAPATVPSCGRAP